ncbi:hypothetical protein CNR22_23555 [Sphingobacteriaceae bacterium]|nr:hypothetical protein CNR22_23555 [Sphingobacteriaceae bacterium]
MVSRINQYTKQTYIMSTPEINNPTVAGSDPKEKNPQQDDKKINPSKPGSDPDQTPERETNKPPVAEPEPGRTEKPGKIGF